MLKVSCILTSYNRPVFIRNAIESVINQTYPHWELIVVDDNSSIKTQNVIRSYIKKCPKIRMIQTKVKEKDRPKTTRYATCINLAIPRVTGDLVTYLTDDDIYYTERFEKMVEVFEKNPDICVLYGKQCTAVVSGGTITISGVRPLLGVTRKPEGQIDHNSIMHRTSCFQLVPRWKDDPAIWAWADAAFFQDLAKHWGFHPLDFLTDEHRFHEHSIQFKYSRQNMDFFGQTE